MAEKKYYGIYQGIVTSNADPEKRGRIKVKCPDALGVDTVSAWCDPCVPVSYDGGGDFCIPIIDDMVWLLFIRGDVNKPVWLGSWWQKNKTPLATKYEKIDKVRIINFSNCTITMKDNVIEINVGNGTCDLKIEDNKVTVRGDLVVTGNITAGNITASKGDKGGGTIKADTSVTANGISLTTHKHSGVESGNSKTGSPTS